MSTISTTPTAGDAHGHGHDAHGHGNGHDPHLAHHFDTPEQQFASGKLGMWVFLATEILMFGGLFCAYAVYRHNHQDVFEVAHKALDKNMGAINTVVLITSSLTMAWGVRLAQLGKTRGLIITLILTILGGYVFMAIKTIEYKTKWEHHLGAGVANQFRPERMANPDFIPGAGSPKVAGGPGAPAANTEHKTANPEAHDAKPEANHAEHKGAEAAVKASAPALNPEYVDPNAGTPDAATIKPVVMGPRGMAHKPAGHGDDHGHLATDSADYAALPLLDKARTYTFFQVYFMMTGLHGIHVLVGMALIFWILLRAVAPRHRPTVKWMGLASVGLFLIYTGVVVGSHWTWVIGLVVALVGAAGWVVGNMKPSPALAGLPGEFGPDYFTPVDIVGLYWHLVDLIWIFLFPLLYLIH